MQNYRYQILCFKLKPRGNPRGLTSIALVYAYLGGYLLEYESYP
jgi:hypothetical protein